MTKKYINDLFAALEAGNITRNYPNATLRVIKDRMAVVLYPASGIGGIAVFVQESDYTPPANMGQLLLRIVSEIGKMERGE